MTFKYIYVNKVFMIIPNSNHTSKKLRNFYFRVSVPWSCSLTYTALNSKAMGYTGFITTEKNFLSVSGISSHPVW